MPVPHRIRFLGVHCAEDCAKPDRLQDETGWEGKEGWEGRRRDGRGGGGIWVFRNLNNTIIDMIIDMFLTLFYTVYKKGFPH